MDKALQALNIALALIDAGMKAYARAQAVISAARAEGRDISDAELDALQAESRDALADFKAKIGA